MLFLRFIALLSSLFSSLPFLSLPVHSHNFSCLFLNYHFSLIFFIAFPFTPSSFSSSCLPLYCLIIFLTSRFLSRLLSLFPSFHFPFLFLILVSLRPHPFIPVYSSLTFTPLHPSFPCSTCHLVVLLLTPYSKALLASFPLENAPSTRLFLGG